MEGGNARTDLSAFNKRRPTSAKWIEHLISGADAKSFRISFRNLWIEFAFVLMQSMNRIARCLTLFSGGNRALQTGLDGVDFNAVIVNLREVDKSAGTVTAMQPDQLNAIRQFSNLRFFRAAPTLRVMQAYARKDSTCNRDRTTSSKITLLG